MTMERCEDQPDLGWGRICEQCLNRHLHPPKTSPYCKAGRTVWYGSEEIGPATLERLSVGGQRVQFGAVQHRDYVEWCCRYSPKG